MVSQGVEPGRCATDLSQRQRQGWRPWDSVEGRHTGSSPLTRGVPARGVGEFDGTPDRTASAVAVLVVPCLSWVVVSGRPQLPQGQASGGGPPPQVPRPWTTS